MKTEISAEKARQGRGGTHVLTILIVSTLLIIAAFTLFSIF